MLSSFYKRTNIFWLFLQHFLQLHALNTKSSWLLLFGVVGKKSENPKVQVADSGDQQLLEF